MVKVQTEVLHLDIADKEPVLGASLVLDLAGDHLDEEAWGELVACCVLEHYGLMEEYVEQQDEDDV